MGKKELKPSGPTASLHPTMAEEPTKPKHGSIIRRRRAGSMKVRPTSMSGINAAGCHRTQSEKCSSTDVSILVTEASPEGANTGTARPLLHRQNSEATVVQVLVHRESEEYNNDEDEERTDFHSQQTIGSSTNNRTVETEHITDDIPMTERPRADIERPTTNGSSTIESQMTSSTRFGTEGTTTDVVIDIDSNMSS